MLWIPEAFLRSSHKCTVRTPRERGAPLEIYGLGLNRGKEALHLRTDQSLQSPEAVLGGVDVISFAGPPDFSESMSALERNPSAVHCHHFEYYYPVESQIRFLAT